MFRARRSLIARAGIGQFAGQIDPHQLDGPLLDAQSAMAEDPGLRLASSRGKRRYTGGALTLHTFVAPNGGPATAEVLDTLPAARIQRRALGTFRGVADVLPTLTPPDEG